MQDYKKIADLLYPNITKTTDYWEEKYPARNIGEAEVTRFAPSPTGYMHIGHFFGANLDYRTHLYLHPPGVSVLLRDN